MPITNAQVASALRDMAQLLQAQDDNPFRVAAYRRAAETVARLERPLREIHAAGGPDALDALPGIGPRIAGAIGELLTSGRWQQLERLRGAADPQALFRTIAGVGPELARRFHDDLAVDTLQALEAAAVSGRLAALPGLGARRASTIHAALTRMLDQQHIARRPAVNSPGGAQPPVPMLLEVDREYRTSAQANKLALIAPRRFNPQGTAWLPVLHTVRPGWHFTALYSNTARAHELDRVHDWVVLYGEDADHHEHQYTVVTAGHGPLVGRRVVRGREDECRRWYAQQTG